MASDRPSQEILNEILADYNERGLEQITLHSTGEFIHASAVDVKRKRVINTHARTEPKRR